MTRTDFPPLRIAAVAGLIAAAGGVAFVAMNDGGAADRRWIASASCESAGASGSAISTTSPDEALARAARVCAIAGGDPEHCRASARLDG